MERLCVFVPGPVGHLVPEADDDAEFVVHPASGEPFGQVRDGAIGSRHLRAYERFAAEEVLSDVVCDQVPREEAKRVVECLLGECHGVDHVEAVPTVASFIAYASGGLIDLIPCTLATH